MQIRVINDKTSKSLNIVEVHWRAIYTLIQSYYSLRCADWDWGLTTCNIDVYFYYLAPAPVLHGCNLLIFEKKKNIQSLHWQLQITNTKKWISQIGAVLLKSCVYIQSAIDNIYMCKLVFQYIKSRPFPGGVGRD